MLEGIEVRLNEDYLEDKAEWNAMAEKVVYTGAIDAYFDYALGNLEYRSVRFENEILDIPNFQGNAAVNYTDRETPWTRIIEHKWFEFGKDENGNDLPKTCLLYTSFSGCPCQVSGLYMYLGKQYEKLITIDVVCHGVNSLKAYNSYIAELAKGRIVEKVNFRDKTIHGWSSIVNVKFTDGSQYLSLLHI